MVVWNHCIIFVALIASGVGGLVTRSWQPSLRLHQTKLFGGGGFGKTAKKKGVGRKKIKASDKKKAQQQLLERYGGDIARGTEERIHRAMTELPPHTQMAAELYKRTKQWEAMISKMSLLAQASLPSREVQLANQAKKELEALYQEHNLSDHDMHNLFQKITWDASADAKSVRATIGKMPDDIQKRVDRACSIVADAVKANRGGQCLDVGCGPGVLVPHLTSMDVSVDQIVGIDLSPEMIRNAQQQYRGVRFVAGDFFQFQDENGFDAVLFCSALHDLPDPVGALRKAESLLRPGGKIVVLHAQGAAHVLGQVKANPIMVKRGLFTGEELQDLQLDLQLEHSPAEPGSERENQEGYLAVLTKTAT